MRAASCPTSARRQDSHTSDARADETLGRLPGWKYTAFTQSLAGILRDTAAIQEGGFIGHNFVLVGTPLNYSCVPPRSRLDTTTFRIREDDTALCSDVYCLT